MTTSSHNTTKPSRQQGVFLLEAAAATVVFAIVSIILTEVLRHIFS